MLVESSQILPITKLQKELTRRVRELSESGSPLYILKNNKMEAVMLPFSEYENLMILEEVFEQYEIQSVLHKRMKSYDASKNVSWDDVRENI